MKEAKKVRKTEKKEDRKRSKADTEARPMKM